MPAHQPVVFRRAFVLYGYISKWVNLLLMSMLVVKGSISEWVK